MKLKERVSIIQSSDIEDLEILDDNYRHLIEFEVSDDKRRELQLLKRVVRRRIKRERNCNAKNLQTES